MCAKIIYRYGHCIYFQRLPIGRHGKKRNAYISVSGKLGFAFNDYLVNAQTITVKHNAQSFMFANSK